MLKKKIWDHGIPTIIKKKVEVDGIPRYILQSYLGEVYVSVDNYNILKDMGMIIECSGGWYKTGITCHPNKSAAIKYSKLCGEDVHKYSFDRSFKVIK